MFSGLLKRIASIKANIFWGRLYQNIIFFRKEHSVTKTYQETNRVSFFHPVFWPTASPVVAHFRSARAPPPPHPHPSNRSQASGGYGGENVWWREGAKEKREATLGERKSSMCRSRVARGHFTLMAAEPIEMTAALHDLKVRRQRIIFQWWRRGIGEVKWCLYTTPSPPPLLNYYRTTMMEST